MKLVVCLGNPGKKYARTRHNAGFMVADRLLELLGGSGWQKYENMLLCRFEGLVLVKPQTYMNSSGEVFDYLPEAECSDILIVVDEVNLDFGKLRVRGNGSSGGHNGLGSIEFFLGSREYPRLRIGVGPGDLVPGEELIDYVLDEFSEDEEKLLDEIIDVSARACLCWIEAGLQVCQNNFNGTDCAVAVDEND